MYDVVVKVCKPVQHTGEVTPACIKPLVAVGRTYWDLGDVAGVFNLEVSQHGLTLVEALFILCVCVGGGGITNVLYAHAKTTTENGSLAGPSNITAGPWPIFREGQPFPKVVGPLGQSIVTDLSLAATMIPIAVCYVHGANYGTPCGQSDKCFVVMARACGTYCGFLQTNCFPQQLQPSMHRGHVKC